MPLEDERWEILVEDSTDDQLDAVLLAIARWAVACELEGQPVLVDGELIELPEPPATTYRPPAPAGTVPGLPERTGLS